MAADIESITLVLVGPADSADEPWVGLEHHAAPSVPGELECRGESGRAAAGDHGVESGDHRLASRARRRASSGGG